MVTADHPDEAIIVNTTEKIAPVFIFVGDADHRDGPTWLQLLHTFRTLRTS